MKKIRLIFVLLAGLFVFPQLSHAITIEMVNIPAGSFSMGSYDGDDNESPVRTVRIKAFKMGKYEVTQDQWYAVMGDNPSGFQGDFNPVEKVSWDDIQQFIAKLNRKTGKHYRLPTEAEWEYAARAGTKTKWSWGDSDSEAGKYAWFEDNSGERTHRIGSRRPNPWGLHDMHGNVREWVQDCYKNGYFNAPVDGSAVESGSCSQRVLRGGSWDYNPYIMRSANRNGSDSGDRDYGILGFRLVQD